MGHCSPVLNKVHIGFNGDPQENHYVANIVRGIRTFPCLQTWTKASQGMGPLEDLPRLLPVSTPALREQELRVLLGGTQDTARRSLSSAPAIPPEDEADVHEHIRLIRELATKALNGPIDQWELHTLAKHALFLAYAVDPG